MEFIDAPRTRQIAIPLWALVILALAYALPGNFHAPWRGDDALHIGIAYEMLQDGHWFTPAVAGLPWYENPPLAHWFGALTGLLLGWLLPIADAIRMSTVLSLLVFLWALRETTRALFDSIAGTAALLLAVGSIGLIVHAHEAQPLVLLMALQTLNMLGLTRVRDGSPRWMLLSAVATGAAFLCTGLPGLALTLPLWLLLPLACRDAQLALAPTLLRGSLVLLPLVAAWPLALSVWAPAHLDAWWKQEWVAYLPRPIEWSELLAWFAWPLWPVALWALWRRRGSLLDFRHALPLAALLLAMSVVFASAIRPTNALVLLPPLILLAAAEVTKLRRGAANFFDWFGVMSFSLLGIFVWLVWGAAHFGQPAPLARNVARLATDFQWEWSWGLLLVAAVLSAGWLYSVVRMPYFSLRGALHWALGITLLWGLAATLLLPVIDHTKNYAPIASALASEAAKLAPAGSCIASRGAGDSQRAALYFFEHLRTDPSSAAQRRCPLLLTYASGRNAEPVAGPEWLVVTSIQRGRGRLADSFTLWRRAPASTSPAG